MGIYFDDKILGIKCMNYNNETIFQVEGENCLVEAQKMFEEYMEGYIFLVLKNGSCTYDNPPSSFRIWTPETEQVTSLLKSTSVDPVS